MKTENFIEDGLCYATSPKSYCLYDRSTKFLKKTCKGIPKKNDLEVLHFKKAALNLHRNHTEVHNFLFNKKQCQMQSVTRIQKSINPHYTKMEVQPDFVRVKPLRLNGNYL